MSTKPSTGRVRSTYEFIKAHRDQYSVQMMCRVLGVAQSGYYEWLQQPISNRAQEDARLLRLIRASFHELAKVGFREICLSSESRQLRVHVFVVARGAGSNPTAFQAVSFQPPRPGNGGWGGRVSPKRARGDGSEVSGDMGDEVSVQDSAGRYRGAGARPAETDLHGAGSDDHSRRGVARSRPHAGGGAAATGALEAGAVPEGPVVAAAAAGVPAVRKRYWGQHLWARGYYCASVGAVDEKPIREDIESQRWDEDVDGFKVTAPTEP